MMRIQHVAAFAAALLVAASAWAAPAKPFDGVAFEQKLGATLPMDATFVDADGRAVTLADYFGRRPVVLVLGYYECPNLCDVVWQGLLESLTAMKLDVGRDFDVVAVSIDPAEGPDVAHGKRETYIRRYGREGSRPGWHFLTGDDDQIHRVTDAAGFRYVYNAETDQYAHAAGIIVTTPDGKLSRYLYGVRFPRRDLRLSLVESSGGTIGSPVDQVLLYCYHYDPATGQYGLLIMNVLRGAGALTLAGLVGFVVVSRRRERRESEGRENSS